MLCTRCEDEVWEAETPRRRDADRGPVLCDRCGAAILTVAGIAVGVGNETLASLARFGLASTEQPLLERREKGA